MEKPSAALPGARTIPAMFFAAVESHADRPAFYDKEGNAYRPTTYCDALELVYRFGKGLSRLGVRPGDRVALLLPNGRHWAIADLAALTIGAAVVPLYTTHPAGQLREILHDSGAKMIVVDGKRQIEKLIAIADELPDIKTIVVVGEPSVDIPRVKTEAFEAVALLGNTLSEEEDKAFLQAVSGVVPETLASIIYTSGTTGRPKGVMLTHGNFAANVSAILRRIEVFPSDRHLSFLPLSHAFERTAGLYCLLASGASIYFAKNVEALPQSIREARPTIMIAVPRLYAKIRGRVLDNVAKKGTLANTLFRWAREIGARAYATDASRSGLRLLLAKRLVHRKVANAFGGKIRLLVSGGAPLDPDLLAFFRSFGLPIVEGYGLTETSPVISFNPPGDIRPGTVGRVLDNVELTIAIDGEILVRGPSVMQGYYRNHEETAQAIDDDGWFHTGDIGKRDDDGYLAITDRKKDLIVLANGKNVAPQPLEMQLQKEDGIATALVFGDNHSYLVALVVPDFDRLRTLGDTLGLPELNERQLIEEPMVLEFYKQRVRIAMREVADYERVKRFALLPCDFTQDKGELTPTNKPKRKVIKEKYAEQIDALFGNR